VNLIILIFRYISSFLSKYESNLEIINELFDFSDFKDEEKFLKLIENFKNEIEKPKLKRKNINNKVIQIKRFSRDINQVDTLSKLSKDKNTTEHKSSDESNFRVHKYVDKNKIIEQIYKFNGNKEQRCKLHISEWMIFKYNLCPNRLNIEEKFLINIYEKAKNLVRNNLDIINYLKLQAQFFHVKSHFFSDLQNLCLHFSKKPKIDEDCKLIQYERKTVSNPTEGEIEIVEYFINNKKISDSDKVFYEILSPKLIDIIENLSKPNQCKGISLLKPK
jgi:hypothetical protein